MSVCKKTHVRIDTMQNNDRRGTRLGLRDLHTYRVAVFPAPVRYAGKGNGGEGSSGEGDGEDYGGGGAGTGTGIPGETRGIQKFFPSHKIKKKFFFF